MSAILGFLVPLFSAFQGPIMGLLEKGILAGVVWLLTTGKLDVTQAPGIAAAAYTLVSGLITLVTKTQTAAIASVNNTKTNGVVVVPAAAARSAQIEPATAPIK